MALVITRKVRTILLIILGVLVVGGGGFLIWTVTQQESLAPEEGEASCTDPCVSLSPDGDYYCINGEMTTTFSAGCYESYYADFDGTSRPCWRDCRSEDPPSEPDCSDYETTSTPNDCSAYPNYNYECGNHCYTQVNGPECCSGLPDYCVPEYPSYNSLPYTTPAASQKSELILYYGVISPYSSLAQFIIEGPDGQNHTINAGSGKVRITTGIILETGQKAKIKTAYDNPGGKLSVGWQSVNSGNTCGSGAMGPPTNNDCTRYEKKDVSSYISWANNAGDDTVISRQCWADNKEWEGDYDFNDYFVQLAYLPLAEETIDPSCGTLENNYSWDIENWPDGGTLCSVGTSDPTSPTFPSLGGETTWTCNNDGNTVNCSATRDNVNNPSCGTLEDNYSYITEDWPEGTFCSVGTSDPTSPTFPSLGGETNWTCNNDGDTVNCLATRDNINDPSCGTLEDNYSYITEDWPEEGTFCTVGESDPASPTFPSLGGETTWTCSNDGNTANCVATRDDINDPSCGTLEDSYSSDTTEWPEGTFCSVGESDPASPTFPALGGETTWTCSNDGNTANCIATRGDVSEGETVPQTGVFDTVLGRIIFGVTLILMGISWPNITRGFVKLNYSVREQISDRRTKKRIKNLKRFERRVAKDK